MHENGDFYLALIYIYLFLWCFFYGLKLLKIRFPLSVDVYEFFPMVLFYG